MTVTDFNQRVKKFYTECQSIMETKGKEYARENEVLTDVRELAVAIGTTIVGVLFVYMWKHITALRYFVRNRNVESEAIRSRLKDIANYAAMLAVVLEVGEDNLFRGNGQTQSSSTNPATASEGTPEKVEHAFLHSHKG